MVKKLDLTGQKFGRLTAIEEVKSPEKNYTRWLCKCECGNEKVIARASLRSGETESCGCLQKEEVSKRRKTHGLSRTKEYYSWKSMLNRCYNMKDVGYKNYGGRGITVCEEWRESFETFLKDMGKSPEGSSIDRINNDGNYCPENCKWSTKQEQNSNTRQNKIITFNGKTQTISAWAREVGIKAQTIARRLDSWGNIELALTLPSKYGKITDVIQILNVLNKEKQMSNIFETATRKQYRYPSVKGDLTTEQLWELKLLSSNQFDLNNVAIALNKSLKAITEESFVSVKPTPGKVDLETKLEIVKHIIAYKQDEQAKARDAADKAAKREKLVQVLANKQDEALNNMSEDEIRAKLAELE